MPRPPLPSYYGAASDLDWREAVGECAHNLRSSHPRSVTVPGPCVPCAREGRIAVRGQCHTHAFRQCAECGAIWPAVAPRACSCDAPMAWLTMAQEAARRVR